MKRYLAPNRNLLSSWGGHAIMLAVGFCLMPYVLGVLGQESYGSWIFINSLASYANLLYLGFGQTLSRFVAAHSARRDWERLNASVTVVFTVYSAMGALALAMASLLAWQAPALYAWSGDSLLEVRCVIVALGLNVACGMVGSTFGGVLLGYQRFDVERTVFVAATLFRAAVTVFFLRAEWGLFTLAGAFLATTIVESVCYCTLAYRIVPTLRLHPRYLTRQAFRDSFGFSLKAFVGIIAGQLIAATDTILIAQFMGKAAVVPYYIALRLCQFIQKPIQQIGDVNMPKAGQLAATNDAAAIQRLAGRSMGMAFLMTSGVFVGAWFFGGRLIENWMGPAYTQSHLLMLMLLGAQLVTLPTGVMRQILFGCGHVRTPALLCLLQAGLNLLCCLLLIRSYGLVGVAIGTTVPFVILELLVLLPYALRTLHLRPSRLLAAVVGPALVPLTLLTAYSWLVDTNWTGNRGWAFLVVVTLGGGAVHFGTWALQKAISECPLLLWPAGPTPAQRSSSTTDSCDEPDYQPEIAMAESSI